MGDLVRHTASQALDRRTSRALSEIQSGALLAEATELSQAYICEGRIDNAVRMGERAALKLGHLHRLITAESADDPGLELSLRRFEESIGAGANHIILTYMTRM